MTLKTNKLRDAITFAIVTGVAATAGTGVAFAQQQSGQQSSDLDRITVTGSRIKRAEVEGAVPVTVIDRQSLEASGDVSVADYLRSTTFNSFGSYQTASGSSWTGFSGISLRGLGNGRTLILLDGRRLPTAPMTGESQDLNTVPMAAVERIEILSDGASAVYGSDAMGGVINIITRKDFEGVQITGGMGLATKRGGDTQEGSVLVGTHGERGRILAGASFNKREGLFTRDRDFWMEIPGTSVYSNNLLTAAADPSNLVYGYSPAAYVRHPTFGSAVPGDCTNNTNLFFTTGSGTSRRCQFDHKQTSANLTNVNNNAVFLRSDYQINDNWSVYFNSSVSRARSFGRYAPVPSSPWPGGAIFLRPGTPNHPGNPNGYNAANAAQYNATVPYFLYHRFAAAGPRDNHVENTVYDTTLGFQGTLGIFDLDFGIRQTEARSLSLGYGYVVGGLAQTMIDNGRYNIYDPMSAPAAVTGSFTHTTNRNMRSKTSELFASAGFDMFQMAGGTAAGVIGAESRKDTYQDIYDTLSEANQVVGSSGSSARGTRDLYAAYVEMLFPIFTGFEINVAARHDRYSDYGTDTSPKISMRWQPLESLTLRGSYGEGFRAPPMSYLSRNAAFSAAGIVHRPTCDLQGVPAAQCGSLQVTTYSIGNAGLQSETSKQYSLGAVWDATDWLNMSLDYYNIKIDNQITGIGIGTIVACLEGTGTLCPSGLSRFPFGTQVPNAALGLGVTFDPVTGGIVNGQTGFTNLGNVKTEGYDFTANTNFDLGGWGRLRQRLQASYVSNYQVNDALSIVGRPGTPDGGTPRIRAALNNMWSFGDWSINLNSNYVHGTQSSYYRQWLGLVRTANRTAAQERNMAAFAQEPKRLPSWLTHDIQVNYNAPWNATITVGVQNLANTEAVIDPYYVDFDRYNYNTWGRTPYFRYTQRF